jgi:hypothetical protein
MEMEMDAPGTEMLALVAQREIAMAYGTGP